MHKESKVSSLLQSAGWVIQPRLSSKTYDSNFTHYVCQSSDTWKVFVTTPAEHCQDLLSKSLLFANATGKEKAVDKLIKNKQIMPILDLKICF